jgi:putative transposase
VLLIYQGFQFSVSMKKGKSRNVKIAFKLKKEEQEQIRTLLSKGKESVRVIKRAQVLNLYDQGYTSPGIGEAVGLDAVTVRTIGKRYLAGGLNRALYDLPRPGNPRLLSDKQANQIIAMVCSDAPEGYDRWTLELIAEKAIESGIVSTVGRETIRILLKTHDIKPWREKNVVHPGVNP